MKKYIFLLLIVLLIISCNYVIVDKEQVNDDVIELCEKAYFEGQKDAIDGDIRIKRSTDSIYIWTKSPWNTKKQPIYQPTYLDSR